MNETFVNKIRQSLHAKHRQKKKKVKKSKIDVSLTPSLSETRDWKIKKIASPRKKDKKLNKNLTENQRFSLNLFFGTRDQSFNDSIIESHSGIDYEFLSGAVSNVQIKSTKIYDDVTEQSEENQSEEQETHAEEEEENKSDDVNFSEVASEITKHPAISIASTREENENVIVEENRHITPYSTGLDSSLNIELHSSTNIELDDESEDTTEKNNQRCYKCFNLDHQKLVIIKQNNSVPFYGLCSIKVLHGKLEVLGHTLNKMSKEVELYSPRGSSLLVITNITDSEEIDDFEEIQWILNQKETLKHLKIETSSVVFICSKINDYKLTFIEKYISQKIFPKIGGSKSPQVIFDPKDRFSTLKINPDWNVVLESVTTSTKLLIIGGKGVGKSTFMRYSINRLLNRFEKVRVVDLDPGQSEFTIPGCISCLTVSEAVLGPNYTHLRKTDRSYLSNVNIGYEPQKYIKCIQVLFQSLHLTEDLPTLINYMGFAQGIGLNIISSAITFIKPTDVIQIVSRNKKKNFTTDITPNTVMKNYHLFGGNPNKLRFRLFKISAMSDDNWGWSLESRQVREMCGLAYFGQAMKNEVDCLTSHNVPMYEISLNSIKMVNDNGRSISPAAVNANLVALCSKKGNEECFNVLGYGIVRGVDLHSKKLVLITPEPVDILEKVLYLILSTVSLPPSVYMTANGITGSIPYVMEGELESLGQITRRSYIPANKNLI